MKISKKRLNELANYPDESIDTSDIPELDDEFWKNAKVIKPTPKKPISIRINQKVLKWFKSQGPGYQTHINEVLTSYMKAKKAQKN